MDWWDFPIGQAIEGEYTIAPRDIRGMDERQPFLGCFGYGELEWFAQAYIARCQKEGNRWLALTEDEYLRACHRYFLSSYHYFDDDHGEGDVQPFEPTGHSSGKFFLLDRGLFVRSDDGNYRATERLIKFCSWRKQKHG